MGWGTNNSLLPHASRLRVSTGATGRIVTVALHSATEQRRRRQPGEGTLDRLQSSGAHWDRHRLLQGHGLEARQCCRPRHMCRFLLVPGRTGHLQPRSVFGEGVRMQAGDAQAQELRQPCTSWARLGSAPVSAASSARVMAQEVAESVFGGSRVAGVASRVLRLPEPGCGRCWRCANSTGMGCSQYRQPRDLLARQMGLLEPSPVPWPCADGYQGWLGWWDSTTPQSTVRSQSLCQSPFPAAGPDQQNDNNRAQLWGSWDCPRVSGLWSHSPNCL